ncbi:UDP-N-acetyl glucosamine 2-epimerase, partial [Longispora fulva]|uniref:UDP-N-acetyl glucosamine 2-epimerase n=2 Tax=Bacteria TaxID=2 RepID=UPI00362C72EE
EEINRVLIDSIADFFFTTTKEAKHLLLESGKNEQDIFFVGNTMIDTLLKFKPHFRRPEIWNQLNLEEKKFLVLTLHRPDNVDDVKNLERILNTILSNVGNLPVIFPVHPRTAKTLKELNFIRENLHLIDSLGYLEFNYLVERSKAILTDSGGITEEASILQIPCLTLRENTERPETVTVGTNKIVGTDSE